MPDVFAGGEPRRIVWNDETGEVAGDHSRVADVRDTIARAERDGILPAMSGHWPLRDPRHDPRDFLVALLWPEPPIAEDMPDWLPPSLRDVAPTPFVQADIPEGEVA